MQVNWQLFSQKIESFFGGGEVGKWESVLWTGSEMDGITAAL
jgi:hypothetical protein